MPATEAQVAAARANGAKSKGPVTEAGKARSRRNAYKHGMAGGGVVLPPDADAEIARRSGLMLDEMAPKTESGRHLVLRLAEMTYRLERSGARERAAAAFRAAHAVEAFDEARLAEVDHALGWIGADPAGHTRKLRSMPEGIDRMINCLIDLVESLEANRWDWNQGAQVSCLFGHRYLDLPASRVRALSEAVGGDFRYLDPADGGDLPAEERVEWARKELAELIDVEIEALLLHRADLNFAQIAEDRRLAPVRSWFDPSKEAQLARRYEAATEKAIGRAMREFRLIEGKSVMAAEEERKLAAAAERAARSARASGSFRKEDPAPPPRAGSTPPMAVSTSAKPASTPWITSEGVAQQANEVLDELERLARRRI